MNLATLFMIKNLQEACDIRPGMFMKQYLHKNEYDVEILDLNGPRYDSFTTARIHECERNVRGDSPIWRIQPDKKIMKNYYDVIIDDFITAYRMCMLYKIRQDFSQKGLRDKIVIKLASENHDHRPSNLFWILEPDGTIERVNASWVNLIAYVA